MLPVLPEFPGAAELPEPELPFPALPLYPPGPADMLPVFVEPVVPVLVLGAVVEPPGAVATTEPVVPEVVPGALVVPGFTTVTLLLVTVSVVVPGAFPVDGVDVPVVTFALVLVLSVGEL